MKTGWLIYKTVDARANDSFITWFIEEAEQQNIQLTLVLREELSIGISEGNLICHLNQKKISLPDFAIIRTIEPLLNLQFETLGMSVFNSSSIAQICNDKALTHFEVNKLNILMVDTIFTLKENLTDNPPCPYPFVMKESVSRGGKHVYLINNNGEWDLYRQHLSTNNIIIQSSDVQHGKDLRVFVVGKKIIGAVLRKSKTDFRANFKLGGTATWYVLNQQERHVILKIINHFDFGMVGIDFLIGHNDQLIFNEIEDVVGSRILSEVSNINIVSEYISFIKKQG